MPPRALPLREGKAPVRERLVTMLFLAALLHGVVLLGLTFNASSGTNAAPGLQVMLVSDEVPAAQQNDSATYLAQRTQLGSGNTLAPVSPRNPSSAIPVQEHEGSPDGDSLAPRGDMAGEQDERVLTSTAVWHTEVRYLSDTGNAGTAPDRPLLIPPQADAQPGPQDDTGPAELRGPRRDELWVTPDTRAATLAPYLDSWKRKVERVGTIHYPTAARHTGLVASPVLEVGIAANGTLERALIRQSSGDPDLDHAALEILKLASPFDPFPPELAREYRVLRFAYEWQFVGGHLQPGAVSAVP